MVSHPPARVAGCGLRWWRVPAVRWLQHKLAVRRLEDEHALLLEARQVDALVEVDIVQLNAAVWRVAAAADDELVVEGEVQLR